MRRNPEKKRKDCGGWGERGKRRARGRTDGESRGRRAEGEGQEVRWGWSEPSHIPHSKGSCSSLCSLGPQCAGQSHGHGSLSLRP